MEYEVVELNEMTMIGKSIKTTNEDGKSMNDIGLAWQQIWNMNLDRKYSFDFEVYHNDSQNPSNQTIDIYIAIK